MERSYRPIINWPHHCSHYFDYIYILNQPIVISIVGRKSWRMISNNFTAILLYYIFGLLRYYHIININILLSFVPLQYSYGPYVNIPHWSSSFYQRLLATMNTAMATEQYIFIFKLQLKFILNTILSRIFIRDPTCFAMIRKLSNIFTKGVIVHTKQRYNLVETYFTLVSAAFMPIR